MSSLLSPNAQIEPYCDSDDEVFFGPITMHEVKVIFNIRDASKKKKGDVDRCDAVSRTPDTTAAEIEGRVDGGSVTWNSEGSSSGFSGGQLNTAILASDHTEPDQELDGLGSDECGEVCYTNCGLSGSQSGELDVACLSIQDSWHEEASRQNLPALSSCTHAKPGRELDESGGNCSGDVCRVSCDSSGSSSGVLDVSCLSMQDSLREHGSSPKSPALSSCDDLDDTLFTINKLLALEDDLSPTVLSPKYNMVSEMRASPMAVVAQSETNVCHEADLVGNAPTVDTNLEDESEGLVVLEQSDSVDPAHPEKPGVSCKISRASTKRSSSDALDRSVTCSRGSVASSDKENVESSTPLRMQAPKAVFAPPWRPGGCAQRATPRRRLDVQSPVGMYIRSNPSPSLVQNVRPALRRAPKGTFTPEHKKVPVEVAALANSSLPVVRYASKSAHVLVSRSQSARKLPLSVRKLIPTPEPLVTRHQGRFRLKHLPELCGDVSSSETEVSILVQKTALKTGPLLN